MFLYYHAIELYLKSFLRFHGVSAKCLKSIGHDYKRLLSKASQSGLVLGDIENEVLNMLDGKLWSRSRYLETGFFRGPSLYALSETSKSLRREVSKVLRDAGQPVRMPAHKKSKPCAHWGIEPGPINDGQKPDHDLWPERRRHLNGGRSDQGNERELESGTQTIG